MIKLCVKVLTGVHEGADWLFTSGLVSIGGSAESSVFLCDENIPDQLLALKVIGNRVLVVNLDARSFSSDVSLLRSRVGKYLYPGDVFHLEVAGIRFVVSVIDTSQIIIGRAYNIFRRKMNAFADWAQEFGMRIVLAFSLLMGMLSTVVVLFFGVSGAELRAAAERPKVQYVDAKELEFKGPKPVALRISDSVKTQLKQFAETQSITLQILESGEKEVKLKAAMSRTQIAEFEKLITRLMMDYGASVSLVAEVSYSEEQQIVDGIEIKGVSFAGKPTVTLSTGEKLFVGSIYRNLEVREVDPTGIVLAGSSVYKLPL